METCFPPAEPVSFCVVTDILMPEMDGYRLCQAIRADEKLTTVTSDFVAGGGDGVMAPAGPVGDVRNPDGSPILRESVVAWLRDRGGRLNENQFVSAGNRRWHYPMPRPVICR